MLAFAVEMSSFSANDTSLLAMMWHRAQAGWVLGLCTVKNTLTFYL